MLFIKDLNRSVEIKVPFLSIAALEEGFLLIYFCREGGRKGEIRGKENCLIAEIGVGRERVPNIYGLLSNPLKGRKI